MFHNNTASDPWGPPKYLWAAATVFSLLTADALAVDADFYLSGIQTGREHLRTGTYRIHGHVTASEHKAYCYETVSDEFDGFVALDHDRKCYRLDCRLLQCVQDEEKGTHEIIHELSRSAYTPEMGLVCKQDEGSPMAGQVSILPGGQPMGAMRMPHLDVRLCGFTVEIGLRMSSSPHDGYPRFESWMTRLRKVDMDVENIGNGVVALSFVTPSSKPRKIRIFVNEERGFTTERIESEAIGSDAGFRCVSSAGWEQINDVWVPVSLSIDTHEPDGGHREWTMAIEWESVNSGIDMGLFTEASVGSPRGNSMVVDLTTGEPIVVAKPGMRRGNEVREQIRLAANGGQSRWTVWIASGLVVIGTSIGGLAVIRRRRA